MRFSDYQVLKEIENALRTIEYFIFEVENGLTHPWPLSRGENYTPH